jgi:O-antigen/teichoic acid export membrane protein
LILFGQPLLRLWLHADLGIGQPLLWAISVWVLAEALARVPNLLLNALALVRFQIVMTAIGTLVAWTLKLTLAPWLGVAGILWGTGVSVLLIGIPAGIWRIYRWADHSARQEALLT